MGKTSFFIGSFLFLAAFGRAGVGRAETADTEVSDESSKGVGIPNLFEASPGLFRGGRPNQQGLQFLSQQGVRYIINLENDDKAVQREKSWAAALSQTEDLSPMDPFKSPNDQEITRVEGILRNPSMRPVFVHCQHGQDRTGLVMGLHRVLNEGWTPAAAFKEMKERGYHTIFSRLTAYFEHRTGFDLEMFTDLGGFENF